MMIDDEHTKIVFLISLAEEMKLLIFILYHVSVLLLNSEN